jgi:hypothetical protein
VRLFLRRYQAVVPGSDGEEKRRLFLVEWRQAVQDRLGKSQKDIGHFCHTSGVYSQLHVRVLRHGVNNELALAHGDVLRTRAAKSMAPLFLFRHPARV